MKRKSNRNGKAVKKPKNQVRRREFQYQIVNIQCQEHITRVMSGTGPLSSSLVARSVNFHSHALLKQLTTDHPKEIANLDLKEINYNTYKAHLLESCNERKIHLKDLHNFISNKAEQLFVSSELYPWVEEDMDEYGVKDRYDHLPPLEYFWKLSKKTREELFYKNVKRGDVLYVQVTNHINDLASVVRVQATMGFVIRDLHGTDVKAHLRVEDTEPDPADCDALGRYIPRTRLLVEVLEVDPDDQYIRVGAKGVAIAAHLKNKVTLGKATRSDRPPVVEIMEGRTRQSYDETLKKLKSFTNPRSIRNLAGKVGIDIYSHSSLMYTLRSKFPEQEMYKPLRKAQMARWAHKSVAEGVAFFKKGQHEEAFQCLGKALQIDEENVEAYVAKGALLANLGRFEKAVEDFQKALKYNPNHSNARKYICETLVELGKQLEEDQKTEEAEKKYKQCLEINPAHKAAKDAQSALDRKLGRVTEPEEPQTVLRDLLEMENEIKRKQEDSKNSAKSPRQKSLSPLSKKMALQEGRWQPPPNINTTASFMGNTSASNMTGLPGQEYAYPVTGWQSNVSMMGNMPPCFSHPPPSYPHFPVQGGSTSVQSKEDEEYKARVEKFLKQIEGSRPLEKKDRSKKRHRKDSESRSRHKHRDSRKKKRCSKSSSSHSVSSSSSRSRSRSSESSSNSSRSSTDKSESSGSSKSNSKTKSNRKKRKSKKSQKKKKDKKSSKGDKSSKKEHKKSESSAVKTAEVAKVEDEAIPGLDSLEEKLSAYFKKVEASQMDESEKDCESKDEMKIYKQGICMSLKSQQVSVSAPSFKKVHPVFRESDEDLDENIIDLARKCGKLEKPHFSLKMEKSELAMAVTLAQMREKSRSPDERSHSKSRSHKSYSRSRTRSRSRSKNREDSQGRYSRERIHGRSKSPPYHHEYGNSHGKYRRKSSRESRSSERGKYGGDSLSGLGRLSSQDSERMIEAAKSRLDGDSKYEIESSYNKFKNRSRWNHSDSPPYSKFNRSKTPRKWDSFHSRTPGRWESSRPKTPSRWDSRSKSPNRWNSRPKTPSRWESRPKTPSRWESRPKSPGRWESRPKTPRKWYSRPKTPSKWYPRPKTPSKWDSQAKSPGRWGDHESNSLTRWDSVEQESSKRSQTPERKDISPDRSARFGKWDEENGRTDDPKIGNTLKEMESFVEAAKQKKLEAMKERNKEFLKPSVD